MTQSPSPQSTNLPSSRSTNLPIPQSTNPYVGPRTFTEKEQRFFFGREREARDLTARIVSERLLLFYAQSGAGKSSLLNARVIPRLRDEERFQALPVGRVSGELPAGVAQVDNIYAFNLMTSLDQSGEPGQRLAQVTLSDFLARLARETAVDAAGQRTTRWVYKPEIAVARPAGDVAASTASGPRFALVIDQFEEVITAHPGRWREREGFFRQLNQALLDDPNLWVVLSLREDYVASLDPHAELLFNRLRARFYMERMGVAAALDAVRRPAELAWPSLCGRRSRATGGQPAPGARRRPGGDRAGPVRGAGAVAGSVFSDVGEFGEGRGGKGRKGGTRSRGDHAGGFGGGGGCGPGVDAVLRGDVGYSAGRLWGGRRERAAGADLVRRGADHRSRHARPGASGRGGDRRFTQRRGQGAPEALFGAR